MKVTRTNETNKICIKDISYGDTFISKDEIYMLIQADIDIDCPECGETINIDDDFLIYQEFGVNVKTGKIETFERLELVTPCGCEVIVKE